MISKRYKNDGKIVVSMNSLQKAAKSNVENRIASGVYSFREAMCPVCGHSACEQISEKDRYGLYCSTVICKNCGLLFSNPMMTRESLNLFYLDDYREMYSGKKKADIRFFSTQYRDGKAIIDFIKNYDPSISFQDKLILEIGCGAGGILAAFRDAGAQVMGFDLGSDYLDYGIKDGLRLERGTIEDYQETRKPDIIIYSHVLEHVSSPSEELEHVKKICHDKTLVYIGVPGLLSVQTTYVDFLRYLHIAHLHHFSLGTLKNLLSKHGFTLVFGNEDIRSLFIYNPSCVKSRTINCYHENMNYLMETENKRHINRFKKRVRKWITKLSYYFVNG